MQEGDAPIELELAITPQIDRSLCRAKHHAENVEITLINVARSNPEGIGIGIDHVNRLTFYRPGRIWLSAYIRFNHREYYIDTFEQMIGSPRCTCVADMERVRLYPRYIVLENDQPIQTQITLDYSDAIRRENCPAEEHAPRSNGISGMLSRRRRTAAEDGVSYAAGRSYRIQAGLFQNFHAGDV